MLYMFDIRVVVVMISLHVGMVPPQSCLDFRDIITSTSEKDLFHESGPKFMLSFLTAVHGSSIFRTP
jgi:hypothetical protein